jgi:hypothetical protein
MKKERKHYAAEEKVAILRRHLLTRFRFPICVRNWACNPSSLSLAERVL